MVSAGCPLMDEVPQRLGVQFEDGQAPLQVSGQLGARFGTPGWTSAATGGNLGYLLIGEIGVRQLRCRSRL